jgi:hypothetical protein
MLSLVSKNLVRIIETDEQGFTDIQGYLIDLRTKDGNKSDISNATTPKNETDPSLAVPSNPGITTMDTDSFHHRSTHDHARQIERRNAFNRCP